MQSARGRAVVGREQRDWQRRRRRSRSEDGSRRQDRKGARCTFRLAVVAAKHGIDTADPGASLLASGRFEQLQVGRGCSTRLLGTRIGLCAFPGRRGATSCTAEKGSAGGECAISECIVVDVRIVVTQRAEQPVCSSHVKCREASDARMQLGERAANQAGVIHRKNDPGLARVDTVRALGALTMGGCLRVAVIMTSCVRSFGGAKSRRRPRRMAAALFCRSRRSHRV